MGMQHEIGKLANEFAVAAVISNVGYRATNYPHDRQLVTYEKAKAESAVQIVERWIMARLRHQQFGSVHEVNEAIAPLLARLNEKAFQKLPGSRASTFIEICQRLLQSRGQHRWPIGSPHLLRLPDLQKP